MILNLVYSITVYFSVCYTGIQQALGVGRALMEAILEGEYKTINLERFAFDRVLTNEPLYEENII